MNTILLIFNIGKILMEVGPELYDAFMKILAVIKPTPAAGNAVTTAAVKSAARAIIPVVDAETATKLTQTLDEFEKFSAENPAAFTGA